MDLMARPSNLLAALLTRLRDKVVEVTREFEGVSRGALEPRGPVEDVIADLERLMRDVSLAWYGNLQSRKSALDPDSYAQEQLRAEDVRMHLRNQFRQVLESLARRIRWGNRSPGMESSPLFVLPIDDIDLNSRSWEVLHFIRLVHSPRLVFLMTGNMERLEKNLGSDPEISQAVRDQIPDILRKLIPPNHRRHLEHMTVDEVMSFRPLGSDENTPSIRELLENVPVKGLPPWGSMSQPHPIRTLNYLLEENPISNANGPYYSVLPRLQFTPRVAGDLWLLFKNGQQSHRTAYQEYSSAVRHDALLSDSQRAILEAVFQRRINDPHRFEITVDLHQHVSVTRAVLSTYLWDTPVEPVEESNCYLETCHFRHWKLFPDAESTSRMRSASHQSTAMFVFFHDFVQMGTVNEPGNSLAPAPSDMVPATVVWRDPHAVDIVKVPWELPMFRTFFEWDHFLGTWETGEERARANRKLEDVEFTKERRPRIANQYEGLVFALMAASHDLLFGGKIHSLYSWNVQAEPNRKAWIELVTAIQNTINERLLQRARGDIHSGDFFWANQLALLLAPESAVPSSVVSYFFEGRSPKNSAFARYVGQANIAKAIRERRAVRAAKFIESGMSHVAQALIQREEPEQQGAVIRSAAILLNDLLSWLDWRYSDAGTQTPDIPSVRRTKLNAAIKRIEKASANPATDDARLILKEYQSLLSGRLTWDTQLLSEAGTSREAVQNLADQLEISLKGLSVPRGPYNRFQDGCLCPDRSEVEQALADLRSSPRQDRLR